MAWQEVETDVGTKAGRVKYSVCMIRGGARVSVPADVVAKLGWTDKTRLRLLVGSADVEGRLRLEPKPGGAIVPRKAPKGGSLIIRLGRWTQLAPRDVDAIGVDSETHDDALTIRLPDHARMVPPAPRPTPAPSNARDANGVQVAPAAAKRDVSHQFFNDPKKPPAMASWTRGGGR